LHVHWKSAPAYRCAMNAKPLLLLVLLALAVPSCGKVRTLISRKSTPTATPASGAVVSVTSSGYHEFIKQPGKLVVVDFYADWCPPCKKLSPLLEKAATEFAEVAVVGKLDVDQASDIAALNEIRSIPEVRFFREGKMVDKFVGLISEAEIRSKFTRHTVTSNADPAAAPVEPAIRPMPKDWLPPGIEKP
jgi:thioredoxin 1